MISFYRMEREGIVAREMNEKVIVDTKRNGVDMRRAMRRRRR